MSKFFQLAALLLLTTFCASLSAQTTDEKAIYAVLEEGINAFEARDLERFSGIYSEKASFISPNGYIMQGKAAIKMRHAELFKTLPKADKSSHEYQSRNVHLLDADLAVLTADCKFSNVMGDKTENSQTAFSLVLRRTKGQWLAELVTLTPNVPTPFGEDSTKK